MTEKLTVAEIRSYWTQQAVQHGLDVAASWSDRNAVELEIRQILARLEDGDRVLDVGCANGYSTTRFARERRLFVRGIDYVPEMIAQAQRRVAAEIQHLRGRLEFVVGDVLELAEKDDSYDRVVVTRVIINLRDWPSQERGLLECVRVLRPDGLLLLSEATLQGWRRLNAFRREWALPEIPMPAFNEYVDEKAIVNALRQQADLIEIVDFASTYFVGTRVLKPLLIRALGADIDPAGPNMEWNRWFAELPSWGDYGTQKLFVFRKR